MNVPRKEPGSLGMRLFILRTVGVCCVAFSARLRDPRQRLRQRKAWVGVALVLLAITYFSPAGTPAALAADTGYRDLSFAASGVARPTGEKPQSKLWFNDGIWWGVLFNRSTEKHQIYRYDWASHTWSDTGTVVDDRNNSKADVLWDGGRLYVATAGPTP